ncbi:site-specific DNA-methyltransferase [Aeromonas veronii]|uniref:site-specific DNA-methyltransferase n=1 Tax=Aeromonas veronii TaxID=654 RepID=UPI00106826E0|nr:site-specific DNA-methyltransferase [Aeromonas veronii]TEY69172.1 site-specific DNA-methyltransferase [Aeromonas veronii]
MTNQQPVGSPPEKDSLNSVDLGSNHYDSLPRSALIRLLQAHDAANVEAGRHGIVMNYTGRTAPWQIIRQVKPKLHRIVKKYSVEDESAQSHNEIWDGENLSTMVTLYKHRGQVDLIVTDPPYNTGEDFRYNDKWDKDPNDPDLGELVPKDDGSRHSKWLKFMTPRIWMMREMLKPSGVIAICIDHRELYRLGMLMDEIFKEENRIGIINWQKSYAPKSDSKHISTATEYVLIYAKEADRSKTNLEERTEAMDSIYGNPDGDPEGLWDSKKTGGNPTASSGDAKSAYGIQSPFTGEMHYPGSNYWRSAKASMKAWLEEWGSEYEEKIIDDNVSLTNKAGKQIRVKALVLKGCKFRNGQPIDSDDLLKKSRLTAKKIYERGQWPKLFFTKKGDGAPRLKTYLKDVKKGKVPLSWWSNEDYDSPFEIGSSSWAYTESGHSQSGIKELTAVVGPNHGFQTVKPLRLIKKIIQLWCKPDGLVLDPFAGSGTTGHAVLELNAETGAERNFILIEQGNTEKGDHYASTLTADRVKRVITGQWASGPTKPIASGFRFIELRREKIDAEAVNTLAREEMIDLLLTSYWDRAEKAKSYLHRLPAGSYKHLFAVNSRKEGFFLIWETPDKPSVLDKTAFREIAEEAKQAGLVLRYHVYASMAPYTGGSVEFYKIPDKVLEHIGFNPRQDSYNNEGTGDA